MPRTVISARQVILGHPTSAPREAGTRTSPFPGEKARLGKVASLTCFPTAGVLGRGFEPGSRAHKQGKGEGVGTQVWAELGPGPSYSSSWGRPEAGASSARVQAPVSGSDSWEVAFLSQHLPGTHAASIAAQWASGSQSSSAGA